LRHDNRADRFRAGDLADVAHDHDNIGRLHHHEFDLHHDCPVVD
jgi:hypothetical protein